MNPSDMLNLDTDNFPPLSPASTTGSVETETEKIEILQNTVLNINLKLGAIQAQNESLINQNNKLTKDYNELKCYVTELEIRLNRTKETLSDTHSSGSDTELMDINTLRHTKRKRSTPTFKSQPKQKKSENCTTSTKNRFEALQEHAPEHIPLTQDTTLSSSPKFIKSASEPTPSTSKQGHQQQPAISMGDKTAEHKTNGTTTTPSVKIPPIVVHNKDKWTAISTHFKNNKIDFVSAKNTDEGIKINMTDIDSYRKGTKFLETQRIEFHTFQLQDEKLLHVVIRGVPIEIDIKDVKEELQARDYHPTTVRCMIKRKPIERALPLIVLLLPREEKSIYNITDLLDLRVKVETLRSKPSVSQCFNCQRFGHAQSKCMAQPKCLKCGSGHPTYTCTKLSTMPAKCANCGGAHPANFSGCSFRPKPQEKTQIKATHISRGTTYASAAKTKVDSIISHPSLQAPTSLNPQTVINSLIQSFVTQLNTFAQRFASTFEPGQLRL